MKSLIYEGTLLEIEKPRLDIFATKINLEEIVLSRVKIKSKNKINHFMIIGNIPDYYKNKKIRVETKIEPKENETRIMQYIYSQGYGILARIRSYKNGRVRFISF